MPQTKAIDGLSVTCVSLEPADAYDLLPELAPVLGSLFGARDTMRAVAEFVKASAEGREADAASIQLDIEPILRGLGQTLGGGKLTDLLVRLLKSTAVADGKTIHRITDRTAFNAAFAGKLWSAFAVAAFAFEVTYGNFSDVVSLLPGVTRVAATPPSG